MRTSSGVLAAVPALFSEVACCGPIIFLVGVQATGVLIAGFQLLVPVAGALLLLSLLLIGRHINPALT